MFSERFFGVGMFIVVLACFSVSSLGHAATVANFDFEEFDATSTRPSHPGAHTSITCSDAGLTLTLYRQGDREFDIIDLTGEPFPSNWNSRGLDPFCNTGRGEFIGDFSSPVTAVSVELTDFGGSNDYMRLEAWSEPGGDEGSGVELAADWADWHDSSPEYERLEVSAGPGEAIRSIMFYGGTQGLAKNNNYADNIVVIVPEPTTITLLGIGTLVFIGLGLVRRKG